MFGRKKYLEFLMAHATEALEARLIEVDDYIARKGAYSIMPWEEVKEEIERELDRRLGIERGAGQDVAGLIWELRDEQ